jgi:hypothetical protein
MCLSRASSGYARRSTSSAVRRTSLKSWRIQATTGTAAEFFHATAFSPGVHTVVLAHDGPATEKIFTIHRRFQGSTDL